MSRLGVGLVINVCGEVRFQTWGPGVALNSGFTIRRLLAAQQSDNPAYLAGLERICDCLRLAGVPEG